MRASLRAVVFHVPGSLVYRTLDLHPIPPLERGERVALGHDLGAYVKPCARQGLVSEAGYVQAIIPMVRRVCSPRGRDLRGTRTREDLEAAGSELEAQQHLFAFLLTTAGTRGRPTLCGTTKLRGWTRTSSTNGA